MTYEPGWERGYTKEVKEVSTKPVLLVGRITNPEIAEEILEAGEADAILLARQYFADAEWAKKATQGRPSDIRRCVAANYCWRSVDPGRPRPVRLQPRGRSGAAVGRRDARAGRRAGAGRSSSAPAQAGSSSRASRPREGTA